MIPFYVLMMALCFVSTGLFLTFFLYLYQPKYKLLFGGCLSLFVIVGFVIALYYLYHPLPGLEYGWYDSIKSVYIEHFGLLFGFLVSIPILGLFALASWLGNRKARGTSLTLQDSRRTLLRGATVAIPLATMTTGAIAAYRGQKDFLINHEQVSFKDLPPFLQDYKIAQISDVHIGAFIDLGDFKDIMERVVQEKPNRLFITGDLIDDLERLDGLKSILESYAPLFPDGIDYIYGNHEHYRNYDKVQTVLKSTPLHILDNHSLRIHGGDQPVYLVGVNYDLKRDEEHRKAMLDKALKQVPEHAFVILLAHHPEFFDLAVEKKIPLTLSGHTHGGQIVLGGESLVPVGTPYFKGWYKKDHSQCYVNSGAGHWYPVRINCPREITILTFKNL